MAMLKDVLEKVANTEEEKEVSARKTKKYSNLHSAIISEASSEEEYSRIVGLRIAQLRKLSDSGLNQGELAAETGLMVNTISNLERGGNPQLSTLVKICNKLNVSVNDLLDIKTDNYMKNINNNISTEKGLKGSLGAATQISNQLNALNAEQLEFLSVQVSTLAKMNQGKAQ